MGSKVDEFQTPAGDADRKSSEFNDVAQNKFHTFRLHNFWWVKNMPHNFLVGGKYAAHILVGKNYGAGEKSWFVKIPDTFCGGVKIVQAGRRVSPHRGGKCSNRKAGP